MGNSLVDSAMNAKAKEHRPGAILLLEEAVHLLRKAPLFLLSAYAIGTLPFILALFYFWADMSRSADAQRYHAVASLALALLYIWMKCWHVEFAARLKMKLSGEPIPRWTWQRVISLVTSQTLIHATAFLVLPLAALLALPFGWCYAFYQSATVEAAAESSELRSLCKKAWHQARRWPRQNHMLLFIFSVFGTVVFLNVATAIYILPHLIKKYLGFDSLFAMSGIHLINTTFWMVTIGISYLCLNPLVRTVYVLRCFYGSALTSGDDLKLALRKLAPARRGAVIGVALLTLLVVSPSRPVAAETGFVSPEALDRSIDEVMQQREFTWRMPRETLAGDQTEPEGLIAGLVAWIIDKLEKGLNTVSDWIDRLIDWLMDLVPISGQRRTSSDSDWVISVRIAVIALLIGLLGVLAYILWRSWARRQTARNEILAAAIEPTLDLEDEDTTAADLPVNRWLELAREFTQKGSLRLAIRAFYLATLAGLAEHQLITIEKFKSNREYEMELFRRAHQKEGLLPAFARSREIFEFVWYGMHAIQRTELDQFTALQKRLMTIAQN